MAFRAEARGDRWVFEHAGRRLVVDPGRGGRFVELGIGTYDALTGPGVNETNYGSTLWTSPQDAWGWPPPDAFDSAQYEVARAGAEDVSFVGPADPALGLAISKRISAADGDGFRLRYSVSNHGAIARQAAPWLVTRVRGGLTFFPAGDGIYPFGPNPSLDVTTENGVVWFQHTEALVGTDRKLFAHAGKGWLAHVEAGHLFVQSFTPVAPSAQAPREAQVEIFSNHDGRYVELEIQGAFETIGAGSQVELDVTWRLERLPAGISAELGSRELVLRAERLAD